MSYEGDISEIDLKANPNAKLLVDRCLELFGEVQNLTPGAALEARLNSTHGPGTPIYDSISSLIRNAIKNEEPWCANLAVRPSTSSYYRRSKIALPKPETRFFSITTVYMDSNNPETLKDDHHDGDHDQVQHLNEKVGDSVAEDESWRAEGFKGQYHLHPYGEINCVIQIDDTAELRGMNGWQGAGWTSPGAGTHHYPQVRGGALVSLFFLPAGRISYEATPGMPQPAIV